MFLACMTIYHTPLGLPLLIAEWSTILLCFLRPLTGKALSDRAYEPCGAPSIAE